MQQCIAQRSSGPGSASELSISRLLRTVVTDPVAAVEIHVVVVVLASRVDLVLSAASHRDVVKP